MGGITDASDLKVSNSKALCTQQYTVSFQAMSGVLLFEEIESSQGHKRA